MAYDGVRVALKQYTIVCEERPALRPWVVCLLMAVTTLSFMYVWLDPPLARQKLLKWVGAVQARLLMRVMKWGKWVVCIRRRKRKNSH